MKNIFHQIKKHSTHVVKHLHKHRHRYGLSTFGAFAVVKSLLLLTGFFGILNIANIFAAEVELNSGNIVTEYGCATDATGCNLSNKGITSIAPDTFINHTGLTELDLSSNQITGIESGDFVGLSALTTLYLNGNQISSIESGSFDGLANLTILSLDLNLLTFLPESITGLINGNPYGGWILTNNCRDTGLMSNDLIAFLNNKSNGDGWQTSLNETCPIPEHTVTFNVDMTNATFDPTVDNVYIAGSFTEWSEPGINPEYKLSQIPDSMIRSVTLQLPEGDIQYKYFINGWAGGERGGDPNRAASIYNDETIDDVRGTLEGPVEDTDEDSIPDGIDNCPLVHNPEQTNSNFALFEDNFDNGTVEERSASWDWDAWYTGWYIDGGKLTNQVPNYVKIRFTDQSLVGQVFSIEADVSDIPGSETRDVGKIRIENPSGNGIEWIDFSYFESGGIVELQVSEDYTVLSTTTIDPGLNPRTLRLEVNGNQYKGYVDDVLTIEYTDPIGYRDTMESQFAGLYINNTMASFDNFALKIFDGSGDACNCADDICTEGNDVLGNPICDPDPACSTAVCGDTIIEGDEQCDGESIPKSCENLGYNTGTLSCSPSCTFDTSACTFLPVQLPDELDEFYQLYKLYIQEIRSDAYNLARYMIDSNVGIVNISQFPYPYYIGAIASANANGGISPQAQQRINTVLQRQAMPDIQADPVQFRDAVAVLEPIMLDGPVPNMTPFSGTLYNQGIKFLSAPQAASSMCTDISQTECDTLVNFYYDTNGDNWTNNSGWLQTGNVCDVRDGVSCNASGVQEIHLLGNTLSGSALLTGLTNLQTLYLNNNQITSIDISGLTDLQKLYLDTNQLTSIDISGLTNLQNLYLKSNLLTEIIGLDFKIENNITQGDIRNNYLSYSYISDNADFFSQHNILYDEPQNNDTIGDFSITGQLLNQRPIYSGTLLVLPFEVSYQGIVGADAIAYIGVPFDFSFDTLSFVDNIRGEATTVYGGPGDGCYADFVQGTGAYVPYMNTLVDTAMESGIDCSGYPETSCTIIIDPQQPPVSLDHSAEIVASSGMTAWNRVLVDVFTLMGQQPVASRIEQGLLSGMAPSSLISDVCAGMGTYDLNTCQLVRSALGENLGLDTIEGCGAKVYTTTGYITSNGHLNSNPTFIGRLPYTPEGFDINMFVTSNNNGTLDQDLSNNMATVHIETSSGAGVSCINAENFMETTHGDIEDIYIIDNDVCTSVIGLCIEGDMYSIGQNMVAIPDNVYYSNSSCTIPVLPTATNVHIIGNPTIGATLLGSYEYLYNFTAWTQLGDSLNGISYIIVDNNIPYVAYNTKSGYFAFTLSGDTWTQLNSYRYFTVDNNIPYVRYNTGDIYSILTLSGDTWTQLGDSLPNGEIDYLTVDNNIPYVRYNTGGVYSVLALSGDTWTQLGDSFTDGEIDYLTVDNNIPYVRYNTGGVYSVLALSGDTWTQLGDIFPNGISYRNLTVDNNIPYVIYSTKDGAVVLTLSGDAWTQLGDSFSNGQINYLTVDNNIPYVAYYNNGSIYSVLTFSGDTWIQLGDSFTDGQIDYLTVDNNIPYVAYDNGDVSSVITLSNQAQEEGPSSYQRYRNDDPIVGATNKSYTLTSQDAETTIFFEVTPKSSSLIGLPVISTGLTIPVSEDLEDPDITPPQQQSNGGGGGGSYLKKDICDGRDCSNSYYDGICGPCDMNKYKQQKDYNASNKFLIQNSGLFNQEVTRVKKIMQKKYSDELVQAYVFAKDLGITTLSTIDQANLEGNLIRSHMAKMITNYAIKVLQLPINTGATCSFTDMATQSQEMQTYVQVACQLGLMGQKITSFRPDDTITRAEVGTVISRMLRGTQYEGGIPYYKKHLQALNTNGIMTETDNPTTQEMRGWIMLMLMRTFKK